MGQGILQEVFTLPPLFQPDSSQTLLDLTYSEWHFFALELLDFSSDFPVHAHWTGESDGLSSQTVCQNMTKPAVKDDWTAVESLMEVHWTPKSDRSPLDSNRLQSLTEIHWTPTDTKQVGFLISIINKK